MSIKSEITFAIKYLQTVKACNNEKSTITAFSPAPILCSLAIIYAGSDRLSNQFNKLFNEEIDATKFLKHYSKFVQYCQTSSDNVDFKILLSNRFFVSSQMPLNRDFVRAVTAEFGNDSLELIDFSSLDMPKSKVAKEKAAKKLCEKINNSLSEDTEGRIKNIIKAEEIHSSMNILISNALCMMGKWEVPFNDPILCPFYSSLTTQKPMSMFSKTISPAGCNFTKGNTWKCIGLPYQTRNVWFHILLPNRKDDLPYILEKLSYDFIKRCVQSSASEFDIRATIPAFETEESLEITNILGRSGLTQLFQNESINFLFENDQVNLDKIFHKLLIRIDKNGSFGGVDDGSSSLPLSDDSVVDNDVGEVFIADHPFLFFVTSVRDQNPEKMKYILYMAPELLLDTKHYTKAIDIWAIGCIFAELLTTDPIFYCKEEKPDASTPYNPDQLHKIFSVLGFPSLKEWKKMECMPFYEKLMKDFVPATYEKRNLNSSLARYKLSDTSEFRFLQKLFTMDPEKRITAEEALKDYRCYSNPWQILR